TAVASTNTRPAPPTARLPRCTRCQSFTKPSSAEYWHIGDTAILFRNVTPRIVSGVNNSTSTLIQEVMLQHRVRTHSNRRLTLAPPPLWLPAATNHPAVL